MKKLTLHLKKRSQKQLRVNLWGAIAYMMSILSYLLLAISIFRYLINNSFISRSSVPVHVASPGGASQPLAHSDILSTIFAYGITVAVIMVAAILLVIFPYMLARYYARGLRRIVRVFSSSVSLRSLFYGKAIAAVVPLIGFMVLCFLDPFFDSVFVYCYIACVAFVVLAEGLFYIQLRVLRHAKVHTSQVW